MGTDKALGEAQTHLGASPGSLRAVPAVLAVEVPRRSPLTDLPFNKPLTKKEE